MAKAKPAQRSLQPCVSPCSSQLPQSPTAKYHCSMRGPPILDYETSSTAVRRGWPLGVILSVLVLIFLLQSILLPCLCDQGTVKMNIALAVDGLILVRLLIAKLRKESSRDWMIYLALGGSSLLWIPRVGGD